MDLESIFKGYSQNSLQRLKDTYVKDGLVLTLGAGVSIKSNLPDWKHLMQRLFFEFMERDDHALLNHFHEQGMSNEPEKVDEMIVALQNEGFSLPAIASLIRERSPSYRDYIVGIRNELYRNFPHSGTIDRDRFVKQMQENTTLRAVAGLCAMKDRESGAYLPNKRIHALITTNFDNILQEYIAARFNRRLLRTIERPTASPNPDKIDIYHMHGFIKHATLSFRPEEEPPPDLIILTEQDYFDVFNSPTSIYNYTILYLLREYACLFIGSSLQDDNIRRLLHLSMKERLGYLASEMWGDRIQRIRLPYSLKEWQRYLELRKDEGKTEKFLKNFYRHYVILKTNDSAPINEARESTLRPLGVSVVWVKCYQEIPDKLKEIYQSPNEVGREGDAAGAFDWEDVY